MRAAREPVVLQRLPRFVTGMRSTELSRWLAVPLCAGVGWVIAKRLASRQPITRFRRQRLAHAPSAMAQSGGPCPASLTVWTRSCPAAATSHPRRG